MSARLELDLTLSQGEFQLEVALHSSAAALGIAGPSGAGKTSLLEALCGWRRPARGRIAVEGRTLFDSRMGIDLSSGARGLGYVPQDLLLFEHRDVRANLLAGVRAERDAAHLDAVIDLLELRAHLARSPASLSGGERQRVALGRALCARPSLLLLDEPLAALDPALRRRILPYLLRVRERFGTRQLLVSHDATEITAVCDEVAVLRAGRLVAQGEPARIFAGADTAAGAELGYENVLRGEVQTLATGSAILRLAGDTLLEVPRGDLQPGDEALFAVRADDVLLALERPRGISARNLLAAQVHSIVERGEEVLVVSDLPGQATRLCAELTPASVRELDLRPGREVVLLIKTRACRPLARLVADPAPSTP